MPSARRATWQAYGGEGQGAISIHALREEGDSFFFTGCSPKLAFLSTPSARRATGFRFRACAVLGKFLSTPSARRATDSRPPPSGLMAHFYPRPPRGGRPGITDILTDYFELFLSTPSARRATLAVLIAAIAFCNFYPRPPRGGRQEGSAAGAPPLAISIHALREEGDAEHPSGVRHELYFYPRPPRGGRHTV